MAEQGNTGENPGHGGSCRGAVSMENASFLRKQVIGASREGLDAVAGHTSQKTYKLCGFTQLKQNAPYGCIAGLPLSAPIGEYIKYNDKEVS